MKKWEKKSIILWGGISLFLLMLCFILENLNFDIEHEFAFEMLVLSFSSSFVLWGWFNFYLTLKDYWNRVGKGIIKYPVLWFFIIFTLPGWIIYLIKYGWKEINREQSHAGDGVPPPPVP